MKFFRWRPLLALPLLALPLMSQQDVPLALPIPAPSSGTLDPNKIVLRIGDFQLTAQQLDDFIDVYPPNTQVYMRGPGKQAFADILVRMFVLAEEGRKRKLQETEKFKRQLAFSESNLIAQMLGEQLIKDLQVDDAMLHKYYDDHACEYQTWHARQIVVRAAGAPLPLRPGEKDRTEEEALAKAQGLRKTLAAGADFAELARIESDDTNSGANGGDLGQVRHGQTLPSLEGAICKMSAGEISDPVKSQFGYHVIKLDSKEVTAFEDVKGELDRRLRPEATKKTIDEWIAKTKVVKDPEYYTLDQPNNVGMPAPKKP